MDSAVYPVWYLLQGGQVSGRIQSGTSQQMNAMAHDGCRICMRTSLQGSGSLFMFG
jgi:hypothetical protein